MKITGKKNLEAEKQRGRAAIDEVYLPRINEAMGPKFAIWQMKAANADLFVDGDKIGTKHAEQLARILVIETARQSAQSLVDAATSAAEIDAIIIAL